MPASGLFTRRPSVAQAVGWLFGLSFGYVAYGYLTLPDVRGLARTPPAATAFMELREHEAAAQGRPTKRVQRFVPYSRISANLKKAVLVAEDASFWDHDGVDYDELQKSIEVDWARGQMLRGASTITQQLAKNLYFSPARNPLRKVWELIIARRLEAGLSKVRILELYLNLIEWGDGVWGAEAAARTYFGVSAGSLTPAQSALLAGAIINPRVLNPTRPNARLLRRQQLILRRMGAVQPPEERPTPPRQELTPATTGAPLQTPAPIEPPVEPLPEILPLP